MSLNAKIRLSVVCHKNMAKKMFKKTITFFRRTDKYCSVIPTMKVQNDQNELYEISVFIRTKSMVKAYNIALSVGKFLSLIEAGSAFMEIKGWKKFDVGYDGEKKEFYLENDNKKRKTYKEIFQSG